MTSGATTTTLAEAVPAAAPTAVAAPCYNEAMADDDGGWLRGGGGGTDDVIAYYDRWAEQYDTDLEAWSYEAPHRAAAALRQHAPHAAIVLDAGCGTGLAGRALRVAGYTGALHGVDLSEASLAVARESGAYDSVAPVDLQQPLVFSDDSFDALMCVGVLTYVPVFDAIVAEFRRVVRPGGVVFFTQRQDLWTERHCRAVIDQLETAGAWEPIWISGAEPYLPGNADFAGEIGVHYVAMRVR